MLNMVFFLPHMLSFLKLFSKDYFSVSSLTSIPSVPPASSSAAVTS